jgi:hypothetical protein
MELISNGAQNEAQSAVDLHSAEHVGCRSLPSLVLIRRASAELHMKVGAL